MSEEEEDECDLEIARKRLVEIETHPEQLLRGVLLEAKLKILESE